MNRLLIYSVLLPLWISVLPRYSTQTPPAEAVVHAVLFYSPACGHCQMVINNTLLPMFEQYGDQLLMIGIDVTQPSGQTLFQSALLHFNLETSGVPFLVIGDTYLVGSINIPDQFPGMVEQTLSAGGVDWPAIPGLAEMLVAAQATEAAAQAAQATATTAVMVDTPAVASAPAATAPVPSPGIRLASETHSGFGARFTRDLAGNSLAVIVLVGMLFVTGQAAFSWWGKPEPSKASQVSAAARSWLVPVLCLAGLGVAAYLAYVETNNVQAVCGPVGDCNTVQQSEYARLFGVLPIGILGLVGYILILLAWTAARFGKGKLAACASLGQLGLTAFGVLFSIYLTFLEPFVIGATCAWCLASAIIMTALLWLGLAPARQAYIYLRAQTYHSIHKTKENA